MCFLDNFFYRSTTFTLDTTLPVDFHFYFGSFTFSVACFVEFHRIQGCFSRSFAVGFFETEFEFREVVNIANKYSVLVSSIVFFSFPSISLFIEVKSSQCNFRSFSLSYDNSRSKFHFHRSYENSSGWSTVVFTDRSTFFTFVSTADVQGACYATCKNDYSVSRKNDFVNNGFFFIIISINYFRFQFEGRFFLDRKNCYLIDFCQSTVGYIFFHSVNHLFCLCRSNLDVRSSSFQNLVN